MRSLAVWVCFALVFLPSLGSAQRYDEVVRRIREGDRSALSEAMLLGRAIARDLARAFWQGNEVERVRLVESLALVQALDLVTDYAWRDPSVEVRLRIATYARDQEFISVRTLDTLARLVGDPHEGVRDAAIRSLVGLLDTPNREQVVPYLWSHPAFAPYVFAIWRDTTSDPTRNAAALAMAGDSSLSAHVEAVVRTGTKYRESAALYAQHAEGSHESLLKQLAVPYNETPSATIAILEAVRVKSFREAAPFVESALRSPDVQVRQEAYRVAEEWDLPARFDAALSELYSPRSPLKRLAIAILERASSAEAHERLASFVLNGAYERWDRSQTAALFSALLRLRRTECWQRILIALEAEPLLLVAVWEDVPEPLREPLRPYLRLIAENPEAPGYEAALAYSVAEHDERAVDQMATRLESLSASAPASWYDAIRASRDVRFIPVLERRYLRELDRHVIPEILIGLDENRAWRFLLESVLESEIHLLVPYADKSFALLSETLRSGSSEQMRLNAARILSRVLVQSLPDDPGEAMDRILGEFLPALRDSSARVRRIAVSAILNVVTWLPQPPPRERSVQGLREAAFLAVKDADAVVRRDGLRLLSSLTVRGMVTDEEAIPLALPFLWDVDQWTRLAAIGIASRSSDGAVWNEILLLAHSSRREVCQAVLNSVIFRARQDAITELLLSSPDPDIRWAAIQPLFRTPSAAEPYLLEALQSRDAQATVRALDALRARPWVRGWSPRLIELVETVERTGTEAQRALATEVLRNLDHRRALEYLRQNLTSLNRYEVVQWYRSRWARPECVPIVRPVFDGLDFPLQEEVIRLLVSVDDDSARALLAQLEQGRDHGIRRAIRDAKRMMRSVPKSPSAASADRMDSCGAVAGSG